MDVIYIDFSKAFDKVPHRRLLWKLEKVGVAGKILHWISDFLLGRYVRVQVNEALSEPTPMLSGVPQGSVLGPQLFLLYINDLPSALGLNCLLFADDVKIWAPVCSTDDADYLQSSLDRLHQWSLAWLLPVNKEKCAVLSIGHALSPRAYHLGGICCGTRSLKRTWE